MPETQDDQTEIKQHLGYRTLFLFPIVFLSIYTIFRYPILEAPLPNKVISPYFFNGVLCLIFLLWETYVIFSSSNGSIIRRFFQPSLIIHHIVSIVAILYLIGKIPLLVSDFSILECYCLMDYFLLDQPETLRSYRTGCVLFVRMPIMLFGLCRYIPFLLPAACLDPITIPIWLFVFIFFVGDVYLLWRLIGSGGPVGPVPSGPSGAQTGGDYDKNTFSTSNG